MSAVQNTYSNNFFAPEGEDDDYHDEEVVESKPKMEDTEHLRESLKKKDQEIYEAQRVAQEKEQLAQEALIELQKMRGAYLTDEKSRSEQNILKLERDLNSANENADTQRVTELTSALIAEKVRLNDLSKVNAAPQPVQGTSQNAQTDNYDALLRAGLTSEQKQFLEERPELRDPKKYDAFKRVMDMVNKDNLYIAGTMPWLEEVGRRLEINGISGEVRKREATDRIKETDMDRKEYDRQNSRKDQDDYRGREGRQVREREAGPMSMPKGESSSDHSQRVSPNGARLTDDQRTFAKGMGLKEHQYALGLGYMDYAKKRGLVDDHRGGFTVKMDDYGEYMDMINSQKQRRRS